MTDDSPLFSVIRIEAPHFVAGLTLDTATGVVVAAAPIIRYMRGWTEQRVREYATKRNWTAAALPLKEIETH